MASPPGLHLFEHTGLLVEVLAPYPDLRIVRATSWVLIYKSVTRSRGACAGLAATYGTETGSP
jgi:hypothetical protein